MWQSTIATRFSMAREMRYEFIELGRTGQFLRPRVILDYLQATALEQYRQGPVMAEYGGRPCTPKPDPATVWPPLAAGQPARLPLDAHSATGAASRTNACLMRTAPAIRPR
jgi:hypothetical protein